MNQLASFIEHLLGTEGESNCDVFLCGSEKVEHASFDLGHSRVERDYCDGHYRVMTGVDP